VLRGWEWPARAMAEDTNRETELKLAVRPEDLGRLRGAPVLKERGKGKAVTRQLESTYFDTPDLRLARRRVTLRVRRQGAQYIQTVKGAVADDGGLSRDEWEWPVPGPAPDLSVITEPAALQQLGTLAASDLEPVFASHIRRTVRILNGASSTIELAIDEGEIRTMAGAVQPVAELELELMGDGDPADLFAVALELAKVAPLRVEVRTKAARGYALASGEADGPVKAEKLALDPSVTVEGALCRIVRSCLNHLAANEACSLKGADPEGIHQMRVALRRLRSALALFRPFVPPEQYDWLVGEVKWLGGHLGPARDWDVFLTELHAPVRDAFEKAGEHGAAQVGELHALEHAAEARRQRAYQGAREAILSARYGAFQLELTAWLEGRRWRGQPVNEQSARLFEPVDTLAGDLLAKRHRKARKAGKGFAALSVDDRHQLRIALKKLRYAAEFFRPLYADKAARRYIQQLAGFQDALGHLNDVATATRLLRDLHDDGSPAAPGERRAAGIVIGWLARGMVDAEPSLVAQWESFEDAKPFWTGGVRR